MATFQDITIRGIISIGADASFLNPAGLSLDNIFAGKLNEIRVVTSDTFPTIQDAVDDLTAGGLVMIPSNHDANDSPTSVPSNVNILDLRGGVFSIGKWNNIRVVDGNKFSTTDAAITNLSASGGVVLVPSNYGGADATSIPANVSIIDLRDGRIRVDLNANHVLSQSAFALVHALKLSLNADAGGDYSSASKVSYEPLRIDLNGRTKGQQIALGIAVNAYGIGDALMIGGDIFGYGGKFVSGTSQPTVEFAEINVRQGNKVFTAQISGDPAASATTLNYTAEANEDVLGERLLLNTSRTTSTGTVTGIANDVVSFSGAPDWTTFSPSPVGQYFKIDAEDVTLSGVSTGHWYRVTEVVSSTQLRLETTYSGELASTGAYTLAEGAEIVGFDSAANTLTIESNSYDWAAGDVLHSPPGHLINFRGLSLILSKEFKTGTARVLHASNTLGPFRWEKGILLEGNSSGAGGFVTGIDFLNINADVGLSLEKSTYSEAAIKLTNNQNLRWSTDADFTFDGTRFTFSRSGNFTSVSAGVVPLLARHAASPTVSYFSLERDDGALIFGVNKDGVVRMKPAFGTGLEIDPDSVPTIRTVGGNTNVGLRLDSKGNQPVAVNANTNAGTGGLEVWSGGASPSRQFHADASGNIEIEGDINHDGSNVGFYGTAPGAQASASAALTGTPGTADGAMATVSGSGADTDINNNFQELTDKVNDALTALRNIGIIAG